MSFDFMKPDIWNGLVLGAVVIGLALASLRLYSDWSAAKRKQSRSDSPRPPHDSHPS